MQSSYSRFNCAHKQCTTKIGDSISLFSFPKDPQCAKIWALHCNREDLISLSADDLNKNFKLCLKHFSPEDVENWGWKKRLRKGAVPMKATHERSPKKGNKETVEEAVDPLDINSTDLASLFGSNVEFVIEEESHVISISEATEKDGKGTAKNPSSTIKSPPASSTPASSTPASSAPVSSTPKDFNSSFMSFVDKKVAKVQQQTGLTPQRNVAEPTLEKPPRAPKRKLIDSQPPKEKPVVVTPAPRQEQQVVVPTPTQLFLVNPGPIPLAIQLDPSGVGYLNTFPLQSMQPLIVPTLPVALNNQSQVQLAVLPNLEPVKRPEPRAVDKVNILRKKPRVETPPEISEEPSLILSTPAPVVNDCANLQKLLYDTKQHLSKATNKRSNVDKAEYIMVVDNEMENKKEKVTILNDKLRLNIRNEFDEQLLIERHSTDKTKDKEEAVNAEANGDVDSAPSHVDTQAGLCYVPNCSLKKGEKVFLFKAPFEQQILDIWQKCIGRKDRPLTKTDTVCEKHFIKEDIEVLVQHHDRSVMAFPRLKKTAVPCVEYYEDCCVPRCGRTDGRMYRFPVTSPPAVQLWLYMLKSPELMKLPIEELVRHRVCERHFERTSFDEKGELDQSAAPMRNVPVAACKLVEVNQEAVESPIESPKKASLKCIFQNCPLSKGHDPHSRMFLFPKDFDRIKQWLRACKRIDLLRSTSARTLMNLGRFGLGVCSRHFVAEDFSKPDRSQLKAGVIPKVDPSNDVCIVLDSPTPDDQALSCAVVFCEEGSRPLVSPLTRRKHFPFPDPKEDQERYHIWLKLVGNPELLTMDPEVVRNKFGVCRKHFEPHFYNGTAREDELAPVAVPTKNLIGSKRWLFGTKFYHTKIKEYINNCINADSSSSNGNIKWKISEYLDASQPPSVCTLNENHISFPGLGYHLEFNNIKKPPFEVFNCSKQNFKLMSDFEQGEMISVHSAVIIADDTRVQKEVMQNLIDEMVKSGENNRMKN